MNFNLPKSILNKQEIKETILKHIEVKGITKEQLADALGLRPTGVKVLLDSDWSLDECVWVAEVLGLKIEINITDNDMKKPDIYISTEDGDEVDLNNPEIYASAKYQGTTEKLWWQCLTEIGYAHMYTSYFYPPTEQHPDTWSSQLPKIETLCNEFTAHEKEHRFKDTEENRVWFQKWLYRFTDEIGNMC